jgi:hypothetical protein
MDGRTFVSSESCSGSIVAELGNNGWIGEKIMWICARGVLSYGETNLGAGWSSGEIGGEKASLVC